MASATIQVSVHDYFSAESALKGRDSRKIGNNTYLERLVLGGIGVKYHATWIAKFYDNGQSHYTSGGWQTYTTKDRLNQLLPPGYTLYQKKHVWYLWHRPSDVTCEWQDVMVFGD
jgi:hypothetical protein